jgi:hypothetical protein
MFSWSVAMPGQDRGACGVAGKQTHAMREISAVLRDIGGTCGVIQICRVSVLGPEYVYGSVVARCEIDRATGAIVWRDVCE